MSVFIIAEAGVNHNGDISIAKKLIDVAAEAQCDAVKFQTFKAEKLVTKYAQKAKYQKENIKSEINNNASNGQYEMLKGLELDTAAHTELLQYSKNKGIMFLSTPFDMDSVDLLQSLGIEKFKIPSGEITNKQYIEYIAKLHKPIILSTGMADMDEIKEAVNWIYSTWENAKISLLHCTTNYPTLFNEVNLLAMRTMQEAFGTYNSYKDGEKACLEIGYSDHTEGIEVAIAAVALGARVIEKHFTLDKNMEGPDHKASIEPDELYQMVRAIRNIEKALGDGIKEPTESEYANKSVVRKSVVAAKEIKCGEIITADMLEVKRPGDGIAPKYLELIIGKKADKDYKRDEQIKKGLKFE